MGNNWKQQESIASQQKQLQKQQELSGNEYKDAGDDNWKSCEQLQHLQKSAGTPQKRV